MFGRKKPNLSVVIWRFRAQFVDFRRTKVIIADSKRLVPDWMSTRFQIDWPGDVTVDSIAELYVNEIRLGLGTQPA